MDLRAIIEAPEPELSTTGFPIGARAEARAVESPRTDSGGNIGEVVQEQLERQRGEDHRAPTAFRLRVPDRSR